jgi:hypothetical protein
MKKLEMYKAAMKIAAALVLGGNLCTEVCGAPIDSIIDKYDHNNLDAAAESS